MQSEGRLIKDDDVKKEQQKAQLWILTQEVVKRIYAQKAGAQINVPQTVKQHMKQYSPRLLFPFRASNEGRRLAGPLFGPLFWLTATTLLVRPLHQIASSA